MPLRPTSPPPRSSIPAEKQALALVASNNHLNLSRDRTGSAAGRHRGASARPARSAIWAGSQPATRGTLRSRFLPASSSRSARVDAGLEKLMRLIEASQ